MFDILTRLCKLLTGYAVRKTGPRSLECGMDLVRRLVKIEQDVSL